jgi:hypothetical protein
MQPQPAATRAPDANPEIVEQLPKYEAAPPGYDTLYKDAPPPPSSHNYDAEAGEPSRRVNSGGDVVINVPEPALHHHHQRQQQESPPLPPEVMEQMSQSPPPQDQGILGRVKGLAGRVMRR